MTRAGKTAPGSAVLIAGPTASGKSGLALALAERHSGIVVNADALQVYRELRILTARPSEDEERAVPHLLYGQVAATERYSVGRWLREVGAVLAEARRDGTPTIIVGGTGLYFKALTEGLAPVPEIPDAVRERLKARLAEEGAVALHNELTRRDPDGAAKIRVSDRARILRSLEVLDATGRSLSAWHAVPAEPLVGRDAARIVLWPDREALGDRIKTRLENMIAAGALEEAASFARLGLDPAVSAAKALGLRPFASHLAGRLGLEEATQAAIIETNQYAKRQMTWFRNQMSDWPRLDPDEKSTVDAFVTRIGERQNTS